jgi:hypothetical protein
MVSRNRIGASVLDQFETLRGVCVRERFFALLRMTAAASVILNVVKDLWVITHSRPIVCHEPSTHI